MLHIQNGLKNAYHIQSKYMNAPYIIWYFRIILIIHIQYLLLPFQDDKATLTLSLPQCANILGVVFCAITFLLSFIRHRLCLKVIMANALFIGAYFWYALSHVLDVGIISILLLFVFLPYPILFDYYLWNSKHVREYYMNLTRQP
jgi:hypothetical protein